MFVISNKGFFRSQNGLNQLDSVRQLATILNLPNGFTFMPYEMKIQEQLSLYCKFKIKVN